MEHIRSKFDPRKKNRAHQPLQNCIKIFIGSPGTKMWKSEFNIISNCKMYGRVPFQNIFTIKHIR